jgi:acyl-coenzyme A thioesterase 13
MKWKSDKITDSSLPLEERVRTLLAGLNDPGCKSFDTTILGGVELLSASQHTKSVQYAFTVAPNLCNRGGNLHGGAATTLFDSLTTTALLTIAKPGFWDTLGVSRTLTVTFLRPLPLGTKVFLDCEVVAAGKRLANLRGTMRTADGRVCATCIHDKAILESPKL